MLAELTGEDSRLAMTLIDAATVGLALASDPSNPDLRGQAARIWSEIRSTSSHHLTSEDELVFPWAAEQQRLPPDTIERAKKQHRELRGLAKVIQSISFQDDSDSSVVKGAKALWVFATRLDDLIVGEEKDLLPMLRHVLFEPVRSILKKSTTPTGRMRMAKEKIGRHAGPASEVTLLEALSGKKQAAIAKEYEQKTGRPFRCLPCLEAAPSHRAHAAEDADEPPDDVVAILELEAGPTPVCETCYARMREKGHAV